MGYFDDVVSEYSEKEGDIKELKNINGEIFRFKVQNGLLREVNSYSGTQEQTKLGFGFKWKQSSTYESSHMRDVIQAWLLEKYFDGDKEKARTVIPSGCHFLDAGCGAGLSAMALLGEHINHISYLGVDISDAVDVAKMRFYEKGIKGEFIQADLGHLPFEKPMFDVIFSEGVLHHTDSTKEAIRNLSKLLLPGGRFVFYVYAKKSPIREFCDDYIRQYLCGQTDEQAWEELMPLTRLGKAIGDLNIEIEVPCDIHYLGIKKGKINIQRLFYWNIFKAFYRPDFSLEEMNHINYDWYRPLNCHRHTPDEIELWCQEIGLRLERLFVEEAGISVIAVKGNG